MGGPSQDGVNRLKLGRLTASNDKRRLKDISKRPWLDTLRHHPAVLVPDLPYVQQVYVNGVRIDWPKMQSQRWVTAASLSTDAPRPIHSWNAARTPCRPPSSQPMLEFPGYWNA